MFARCRRQNQRLCKGESFRAFCLHTSLHGWRHLADRSQPRGATERSMWAAVVLLAVVTAATFLYNNTWVSALALARAMQIYSPLSSIPSRDKEADPRLEVSLLPATQPSRLSYMLTSMLAVTRHKLQT